MEEKVHFLNFLRPLMVQSGFIIGGSIIKERKVAKIRNRYNQVPHLTQYTTLESDKSTTNGHKLDPRDQDFRSR